MEVARGPHLVEQKKTVGGMDVWKRLVDERADVEEEEEDMDVDG